jgi:hypothetical protein
VNIVSLISLAAKICASSSRQGTHCNPHCMMMRFLLILPMGIFLMLSLTVSPGDHFDIQFSLILIIKELRKETSKVFNLA